MVYSKPALTVSQQLHQLKSRGLSVTDHAEAKHNLYSVGYYRLEGYWWTMQSDEVRHRFRPGSSFDKVIERYNFDRELRLTALNMIERVEVGVRTQLIYHLSLAHGPFWFENRALAKSQKHWVNNDAKLKDEVARSKEKFILEHRRQYHADTRSPPSWKSLEVISLGLLSKIYRNIADNLPEKSKIAQNLGMPTHLDLTNWLHAIALLRNVSAHHCRLFERSMEIWPALPNSLPNLWMNAAGVNAKSVYAHICCLQYLLHTISPNNRFTGRLAQLFKDYPQVKTREVGFPANWKKQPLWQ